MEYSTLVLLLALVGACHSSIPCPQACKCSKRPFGGIVARCAELDPDVQRFSSDVTHLVVDNFIGDRDMILSNMIFVDMGLNNVITIKIINSTLREINLNAFHGLNHLEEVDLSNNRLVLIYPDIFQNNKKLFRVLLKGNPLQLSQDHPFLNSMSIRELDLSYCRLAQILPKTFSNLPGLELLDLSGNDLTEIKDDTLANLGSLEDLYLSHNSIGKIDPDAFLDIDDMVKLSLKGNPLKTLEGIEIYGLSELDVSECDLEILASATFDGFPDLNSLNLSGNSIRDIDPGTFSTLENLKYIDLSNNMIRGPLDKELFSFNKKLESLSLSGNKELGIFKDFDSALPRLYHLDLSDCGIAEIDDNSFLNVYKLARLNLSNNYLQHVKVHLFDPLIDMTVLDLSNNKLHYINNKVFSTNRKLVKLSLAGNYFHHVPAVVFLSTPNLEWLDLSNCRLTMLWNITEAFTMKNKNIFSNLHYLNVSGNKLAKLHRHSFISMDKLGKLDISNNPIQCTSDFSHVMQWLIVNRVMPNKGIEKSSKDIDFIDNNIIWDEVLRVVCPINIQNSQTSHTINPLPVDNNNNNDNNDDDTEKNFSHNTLFKNIDRHPGLPRQEIIEEPISFKGPEEITKIEPLNDSSLLGGSFVWPMILIWGSILSILIAVGNLIALLICRSRRQYRVLSFKPHYTGSLESNFPARISGGRSPYQKLYEECSVPTPVHDKKIKIVTILENAFQKNNSKV